MDRVVREPGRESDASLFRIMAACGEKASEQGQVAFREIYQRYCEPLFRRCCRFSKALGGDSGVQDLVQDTFVRAYERAGTHQSHAELGPAREAKKTLRWLNRIGTRLFLDLREKQIKERAAR